MNSIRLRLFLMLMMATGVVWLSGMAWTQYSTRAELRRVLDARLAEAAQMVSSLISDRRIDISDAADLATAPPPRNTSGYSHRLSCQIWSLDGTLVGRSGDAPAGRLAGNMTGFANTLVDGTEWRVHTVVNEDLGLRVMVGDSLAVRNRLVSDVTKGLVLPALLILPGLAALIWISVGRGLAPLSRMAGALAARDASDLSPLETPLPGELRPFGAALNGLFHRVESARARERDFTAFAAHELKTPLAGLKTQAQIAAMAEDDETRRHALSQIQSSVTRTDRLARQLLDLTRAETVRESGPPVSAASVLHETAADLARMAAAKSVEILVDTPDGAEPAIEDAALLGVALRNLLENAIQAAPAGSPVDLSLHREADTMRIMVQDRGSGIAEDSRARATDRFYRGPDAHAQGSGLGLAIVASAADRLGGTLTLEPRTGGGEAATLKLPIAGA